MVEDHNIVLARGRSHRNLSPVKKQELLLYVGAYLGLSRMMAIPCVFELTVLYILVLYSQPADSPIMTTATRATSTRWIAVKSTSSTIPAVCRRPMETS